MIWLRGQYFFLSFPSVWDTLMFVPQHRYCFVFPWSILYHWALLWREKVKVTGVDKWVPSLEWRPGLLAIVQTWQKYIPGVAVLHSLETLEKTLVVCHSLKNQELFPSGGRFEASAEFCYTLSLPGVHHQPAPRHQIFPLPTCNGHVHPEALCWSPGIQVSCIWHHHWDLCLTRKTGVCHWEWCYLWAFCWHSIL